MWRNDGRGCSHWRPYASAQGWHGPLESVTGALLIAVVSAMSMGFVMVELMPEKQRASSPTAPMARTDARDHGSWLGEGAAIGSSFDIRGSDHILIRTAGDNEPALQRVVNNEPARAPVIASDTVAPATHVGTALLSRAETEPMSNSELTFKNGFAKRCVAALVAQATSSEATPTTVRHASVAVSASAKLNASTRTENVQRIKRVRAEH